MNSAKTAPKTADQLAVGDRVKFGKDDFRTITGFEVRWEQYLWMTFDPATCPAGSFNRFDTGNRATYRVAL